MKQQAQDFRDEIKDLAQLLEPLQEDDFDRVTQFKGWTINDVLGHLHMFDVAADFSLQDDDLFLKFFGEIAKRISGGASMLEAQYPFLKGLKGRQLLQTWHVFGLELADRFEKTDPKARLKWAGPDMSARSSITARQMETWAHGNEVFDLLGVERVETDRIRNVVHLGVSTYGWTFLNRGLAPPEPVPWVNLTSPSGQQWTWNEKQPENRVSGSTVEFAWVVTQGRNILDTKLSTKGEAAKHWMEIAQCFAGPAETPPQKGARFTGPRLS